MSSTRFLRQTEGLVGSIVTLLGIGLALPDHTTLSRRSGKVVVPMPRSRKDGAPVALIVDSTGLKFHGPGEWTVEKHGTKTRKSWRKLHLGLDSETGEIVATALTDKEDDDGAMVGPLLDQMDDPVRSFTADGAYDTLGVSKAVADRHPNAAIIVPPRITAILSETAQTAPTRRDEHLMAIQTHGRSEWQKRSGYNVRSRVENAMGRYKKIIGDALHSTSPINQKAEVRIAAYALNRMTKLGRPDSVRTA